MIRVCFTAIELWKDMAAFNQYFGKIKIDIKKTFPKGITKESFARILKQI